MSAFVSPDACVEAQKTFPRRSISEISGRIWSRTILHRTSSNRQAYDSGKPLRLSEAKIQKFVEEKQEWILKNLEKIQKRDAQKENVQKLSALERQHLQNKACVVIPRRVAYYAEKLGVSYGKITLRQQKTRWGSCAANGKLNFNWLLILAPPEVLDYVVVHELCHRREMNHSQAFWKEVEKILPDYRERQKWLKDNGWRLMEEGF